jgi:Galactose mutarotase and related enzymes
MMFTHEILDKQYKVHKFSGAQSSMEVLPERGGIISRLSLSGMDILYLDEETLYNPEKSVRGGIPLLFPICGGISENAYKIGSHSYMLKKHGFSRLLPWKVTGSETGEDSASITIEQTDNDYTYGLYPFHFKIIYRYILSMDSLTIESTFINNDEKDMPFYAGFHPYFLSHNKNEFDVEIPSDKFLEAAAGSIKNGRIDYSRDEIDVGFYNLSDTKCTITDRSRNIKITLSYDDVYKYIVAWSIKGKDFVCVEPWMAFTDALNNSRGIEVIPPGQSLHTQIRISAERL